MKTATQVLAELNGAVSHLQAGRALLENLRDDASNVQQAIFSLDTAIGLLRASASDAEHQARMEASRAPATGTPSLDGGGPGAPAANAS